MNKNKKIKVSRFLFHQSVYPADFTITFTFIRQSINSSTSADVISGIPVND